MPRGVNMESMSPSGRFLPARRLLLPALSGASPMLIARNLRTHLGACALASPKLSLTL